MFIWNGISSDDMDVIVEKLPPISISIPKSEYIEVEGRDGHITQLGGYESDTKEVAAHYVGSNSPKLLNWLKGSGNVIFGNLKDRYYKAEINNKVPLEQLVANKLYHFPIMFRCQPFGHLLEGTETIEITGSTTLYNGKATAKSKPYIKIYGNGDINFYINNQTLVLKGIESYIEVDSELVNCYKTVNGVMENQNDKMYSPFPVLQVGENNISWTGAVTKIELIPRWCCLV